MSKKNRTKTRRTILITAGPTRAYLDDVRYISNYSTGELGYELCKTLNLRGFRVIAVVGPTAFNFKGLGLFEVCEVETPAEMERAVILQTNKHRPYAAIFSAAVLDFIPSGRRSGKVSSKSKKWTVQFVPSRKIIDVVGRRFPALLRVGFKLETKRRTPAEIDKYALSYLREKGLTALVYNQLESIGRGRHNAILYSALGARSVVKSKPQIAKAICRELLSWDVSPSRSRAKRRSG